MEDKSSIQLVSIGEDNNSWLAYTKDSSTIDVPSTNEGRAIKGIGSDGNKVDNISIVDTNKMGKFKDLKKVKACFFTPGARLTFTILKQVFTKVSIFYHFNPKYHIQIKTSILGYTIGRVSS